LAPIALVALAGLIVPASATVTGTLTQLTTASATDYQTTPAVSGSLVVWNDTNKLASGAVNQDIFWEDVSVALSPHNLTNTVGLQEFLEDIDGTNVVFTQTSSTSAGDILVADLSSANPTPAPVAMADPNGAWHYEQPSISGRYIVFIVAGVTQSDVGVYDNSLGLMLPNLTNDPAVQASPRVSGNLAVWEDYSSGNADVLGYVIGQGPAFPIATGPDAQRTPDVDGTNVVWVDTVATGNDQIWIYNTTTRTTRQLTSAVSNKLQPRISGTRVVWSDDRGGDFDVYTYDLAAGVEDKLAGGAGDQMLADMDGNRVVFTSNATGFEQVYLFTLSAPPPPPPPPNLPFGCDPSKTDLVDSAVTLTRTSQNVVSATRMFATKAGKSYFVCVDNGLPSGAERTAQLLFSVDNKVILTPADFKPNSNPPQWVSQPILTGMGHGPLPGNLHAWSSALFGVNVPATVTVSIRVQK
jgi:beta propeller repeat protein